MSLRYRAARVADRGWAVFDRRTGSKVRPESPGHYWEGRRPAEIAAAQLNDSPAPRCAVNDGIRTATARNEHAIDTEQVLGFAVRQGLVNVQQLLGFLGLPPSARNRVRATLRDLKDSGLIRWNSVRSAWEPTETGRRPLVKV